MRLRRTEGGVPRFTAKDQPKDDRADDRQALAEMKTLHGSRDCRLPFWLRVPGRNPGPRIIAPGMPRSIHAWRLEHLTNSSHHQLVSLSGAPRTSMSRSKLALAVHRHYSLSTHLTRDPAHCRPGNAAPRLLRRGRPITAVTSPFSAC